MFDNSTILEGKLERYKTLQTELPGLVENIPRKPRLCVLKNLEYRGHFLDSCVSHMFCLQILNTDFILTQKRDNMAVLYQEECNDFSILTEMTIFRALSSCWS